jgi:2-dehydropantoate 2-reductase
VFLGLKAHSYARAGALWFRRWDRKRRSSRCRTKPPGGTSTRWPVPTKVAGSRLCDPGAETSEAMPRDRAIGCGVSGSHCGITRGDPPSGRHEVLHRGARRYILGPMPRIQRGHGAGGMKCPVEPRLRDGRPRRVSEYVALVKKTSQARELIEVAQGR